ncbi:SDR family oxidoreductase [Rhodoligotrophos ferricapiens]|uniref:SDR family oxidoreductase n=1 Tax=Rhodoligotrophos ferricapiens TaxID=3069264 RepID=UPI00315D7817
MQITGNTILITGGGSGIGRGLAEALHAKGNKVIITGRDTRKLNAVAQDIPGIEIRALDVDDAAAIKSFAGEVLADFPALNVLINNAGIMRGETLTSGETETAEATITTNLLGPIRLTAALLPHLMSRPKAAVLMVSSGLAFVPRAFAPTYCATKAAIHSYAQSLRVQLRGSSVEVIELVPPYVQTELMGPAQAVDPNAMPLGDYISETVALLENEPNAEEILVQRVFFQRWAEREGRYEAAFKRVNG